MKELTDTEIQRLETFAKKHEFFASFLLHYKLKQYLSNNQYYWLHLYINQAEENGDTLLSGEEVTFLEENSENNEKLRDFLKLYEDKRYLEHDYYKKFLDLKVELKGELGEVKSKESPFKHKVVKIPCPTVVFFVRPKFSFVLNVANPYLN